MWICITSILADYTANMLVVFFLGTWNTDFFFFSRTLAFNLFILHWFVLWLWLHWDASCSRGPGMLCLCFVGACFTKNASCTTRMVWVQAMEILFLGRWPLEEGFIPSRGVCCTRLRVDKPHFHLQPSPGIPLCPSPGLGVAAVGRTKTLQQHF